MEWSYGRLMRICAPLTCVVFVTACNPERSTEDAATDCAIGSEGCACTSGGGCDDGLNCVDQVCRTSGVDAGVDASRYDAAMPPDASRDDSSGQDVMQPDTSVSDAAQPDILVGDAARPDTVVNDATQVDAIQVDTWVNDAAQPDTRVNDAAQPDTLVNDAYTAPNWPQIVSFSSNLQVLTPTGEAVLTAIVTDSDGAADIIGGVLKHSNGTTYGSFEASGSGVFEFRLDWDKLNAVEPIEFLGGGGSHTVTAEFLDQAAHVATADLELTLRCDTAAYGACDGACLDQRIDEANCGSCDNVCSDPAASGSAQCRDSECHYNCDFDYHECPGTCLPDNSIDSCGDSCTPCPGIDNGHAICIDSLACGLECQNGWRMCGDVCAECPSHASGLTCQGTSCVATGCNQGYYPCADGCCSWQRSTVHSAGGGHHIRIRIDSSDRIHVTFADNELNTQVRYAHRTRAGAWSYETAAQPIWGGAQDLALDSQGQVHVTYLPGDGSIRLSSRSGASTWTNALIDGSQQATTEASLVLNPTSNRFEVLYESGVGLRHALQSAQSTWSATTIAADGENPRMVIDSSDNKWICYFDDDLEALMLGLHNTQGWSMRSITSANRFKAYDIARDPSNDNLYMAYTASGAIQFGACAGPCNDSWTFSGIPDTPSSTAGLALAIDHNGLPHIAYYNGQGDTIRYAHQRSDGSWITSRVEAVGTIGSEIDIAVDSANRPYIVYLDSDDVMPRIAW